MATSSGIIGESGNAGALERFRTLSQRAKEADGRLAALEEDSGWTTVSSFLDTWANSGVAGDVVTRYRKLRGIVYVEASITGGTLAAPAFQLPAGSRPSAAIVMAGSGNVVGVSIDFSAWQISASGYVTPLSGTGVLRLVASFPADQ